MYVLNLFSCCISIYCTLQYMFSPLVRNQLSRRFPLFYPRDETKVPISVGLLIAEFMNVFCVCLVLKQLIRYRSTQHIHQGLSIICVFVLLFAISFSIFTFACSSLYLPDQDMGRFGIFYLEHINYLWMIGNFLSAFHIVPQVTLNWMGSCTQGVSSKFVVLSMLSVLTAIIGNMLAGPKIFYKIPFNHIPIFRSLSQLIFLSIILYQAQFAYLGRKPILPKKKH